MGARGVSSEHVENMEMFSTEVFSGSPTVLRFSEICSPTEMFSGSPNIKDHNQRGGGKWRMYHRNETRFYQTDDSKVTRRLLKEKSKLTFVDV